MRIEYCDTVILRMTAFLLLKLIESSCCNFKRRNVDHKRKSDQLLKLVEATCREFVQVSL